MTTVLNTYRPWYRRVFDDAITHWRRQRTVQSLRELDSRTLADIGVDVSDLSSIGAEAFGHGVITRRRVVRSLQHV